MAFDLKHKRVAIIGAGKSGLATIEFIVARGGMPFLSDAGPLKDDGLSRRLQSLGVQSEFGGHSDRALECELMIVSPAVPSNAEIIQKAKARGIPVWPEIELAYRFCQGQVVGITGSNGKTTTTALTGEVFSNSGKPAFVGGNIGTPFIGFAGKVPADGYAVIELSSFQLEQIADFKPSIALFLNLTPDHLDRHKDLDDYIAAKMRIFENQGPDDFAVLNHDDEALRRKGADLKSRVIWFSVRGPVKDGIWAAPDGGIYIGDVELMKSSELKIKGEHNLSNACAATAAAVCAKIPRDNIREALISFPGVEHRLEPVRLIGGVSFINDSKGTNVDSVYWALRAVSTPVILIAGGKDKGGDFTALSELVRKKVKAAVLIGKAAEKIEAAWRNITRCIKAGPMEEAVRIAFAEAAPGDTVLLSPGCASFDMFDNYEHRGRVFKQAVLELEQEVIRH